VDADFNAKAQRGEAATKEDGGSRMEKLG